MDGALKTGPRSYESARLRVRYPQFVSAHLRGNMREVSQFSADSTGLGHGSELLKRVCAEADECSMPLMLLADTDRLGAWYERFGFMALQLEPVTLMVRLPDGQGRREAERSGASPGALRASP